jgi:hypothetical protein
VFPQSLAVPSAFNAFDDQGEFADASMAERARRLIAGFIRFSQRFE